MMINQTSKTNWYRVTIGNLDIDRDRIADKFYVIFRKKGMDGKIVSFGADLSKKGKVNRKMLAKNYGFSFDGLNARLKADFGLFGEFDGTPEDVSIRALIYDRDKQVIASTSVFGIIAPETIAGQALKKMTNAAKNNRVSSIKIDGKKRIETSFSKYVNGYMFNIDVIGNQIERIKKLGF